jgi:hypothetical protein
VEVVTIVRMSRRSGKVRKAIPPVDEMCAAYQASAEKPTYAGASTTTTDVAVLRISGEPRIRMAHPNHQRTGLVVQIANGTPTTTDHGPRERGIAERQYARNANPAAARVNADSDIPATLWRYRTDRLPKARRHDPTVR